MLVFGTRPEAIKMSPWVKEFQKFKENFQTIVCVTGQHREMLDQVLSLFEIVPDFDLNIMKSGQDLYDITSKVILGMREVLNQAKPDIVLVHGDTTTSTATAIASFYQQIPIAHIEAGLRTDNIYSPWPEEVNRQITSRISRYNFAPTLLSYNNLIRENVKKENIYITGNTVIDSLFYVLGKINNDTKLKVSIINDLLEKGCKVNMFKSDYNRKIVLITGHRRENFGEGFENICKALKLLSEEHSNVDFIYPMHLNPNVREPINKYFGENSSSNLFFIEPLEYLSFVYLMSKSYLILTDSGGIQEEAPSLGKPVLVMRDTTERPEAVDAGTVKLVGTNVELIYREVTKLIDDKSYYKSLSNAINPYGDGTASSRIVNFFK